jgi:hypothetical protein
MMKGMSNHNAKPDTIIKLITNINGAITNTYLKQLILVSNGIKIMAACDKTSTVQIKA